MGTFRKAGPMGVRWASSPARATVSYRTDESVTRLLHLVNGSTSRLGPPTMLRLRSHWGPGSISATSP